MPFERSDYGRKPAASEKTADADRERLGQQRQLAVSAEYLTADPVWDTFLSILQARLETSKKERERYLSALLDVSSYNEEHIRGLRMLTIVYDARIEVLEAVMALPSDLKARGKDAAE